MYPYHPSVDHRNHKINMPNVCRVLILSWCRVFGTLYSLLVLINLCKTATFSVIHYVLCYRMFGMVVEKLLMADLQKVSGNIDRKICAVGVTKILTEAPAMLQADYVKLWLVD